jgi:DNA-binding transcriptional regulator YiaG
MTATSKQEPPIPADDPVAAVVADEAEESEAQQATRRGKKVVTASVATVPAAASEPAAASVPAAASEPAAKAAKAKPAMQPNNVRKLRQAAMMSKAELARRAGVSPLTIDRVESGCPCRMDTKRKILEALGLKPEAREQVFGPDIDQG